GCERQEDPSDEKLPTLVSPPRALVISVTQIVAYHTPRPTTAILPESQHQGHDIRPEASAFIDDTDIIEEACINKLNNESAVIHRSQRSRSAVSRDSTDYHFGLVAADVFH
ncbi:hypothetical protein J6590_043453, partial [Homalodisca vitripennis]